MIVMTVRSLNGVASQIPAVQFDEIGGTIGRADSNALVLPDQDRTISRLHAQVAYRNGQYALIDLGANAVLHNGQAIGHGREVLIKPGDTIEIGGYKIAVSDASVARVDDPFASFEGDIAALPERTDPIPRPKPANAPAPAPKPVPAPTPGGIPMDWDPFMPDAAAAPLPAFGAPAQQQPLAGMPLPGAEPSLDDLFGLGSSAKPGAPPPLPTRDDHASEMQVPWTEVFAAPKPAAVPTPVPALPLDLGMELDMVLEPTPVPAPAPAPPSAAPEPATTPPAELPADAQALLDAFMQGLDVDGLRLRPVTPQAMLELGQMLREYTRGTMDLLVARGALKKEVRADVTMMAAQANNVLKFSPTVEFALQHLLGKRSPGFMGSLDSLQDAFEDLKSHQLGVMAGMQAALQGVLKRFDPAEIERKVGQQSGLLSLMPSSRKARLWELFQEMYGQSASQAREEFDDLFGKAFARAYDRFVAELAANNNTPKSGH